MSEEGRITNIPKTPPSFLSHRPLDAAEVGGRLDATQELSIGSPTLGLGSVGDVARTLGVSKSQVRLLVVQLRSRLSRQFIFLAGRLSRCLAVVPLKDLWWVSQFGPRFTVLLGVVRCEVSTVAPYTVGAWSPKSINRTLKV